MNTLTDYLSIPSLLDIFGIYTYDEMAYDNFYATNSCFNSIAATLTSDFTSVRLNAELSNILAFGSDKNQFVSETYHNFETLQDSDLNLISNQIANVIYTITDIKTNVSELMDIFPACADHIENFELSVLDLDEPSYEILSTPDSKIYYPEPFIASPSFVHEDL